MVVGLKKVTYLEYLKKALLAQIERKAMQQELGYIYLKR